MTLPFCHGTDDGVRSLELTILAICAIKILWQDL
jgi:hypothetical protein